MGIFADLQGIFACSLQGIWDIWYPHYKPHMCFQSEGKAVKILMRWFLQKPADLDLHCLCTTLLPDFYPVFLQHTNDKYVFSVIVDSSVDPD